MAAIIFDFDGTIADSFETVVSIFRDLTGRHDPIDAAEIERLRGMTLRQVARELHIRAWQMPFLTMRGRQRMTKRMESIAIYPGLPAVIHELQAAGHRLYITSSNSRRNIDLCLRRHRLHAAFINIYGGAGLLNKARVLKKVVRQNSLDPADTWYVGDEVRDVVAARHAGILSLAVGWGYNTPAVLKVYAPDRLITKPAELPAAVGKKKA